VHRQHCGLAFGEDDEIDLPQVKLFVRWHRRLKCCCATCGKATSAPMPPTAHGTPFVRRIDALALYLKTNQYFPNQIASADRRIQR